MVRGKPLVRQWNLLKTIQIPRFGISTDNLAEQIQCCKRQVLRDLNILQEIGFPMIFNYGDVGIIADEAQAMQNLYSDL